VSFLRKAISRYWSFYTDKPCIPSITSKEFQLAMSRAKRTPAEYQQITQRRLAKMRIAGY